MPLSPSVSEAMNGLQVAPLEGGFGVRVQGAVLQALPANPDAAATLRGLLAQHRVAVLGGLQLDAEAFVALAGTLGQVRPARVRHPSLTGPAGEHIFVSARSAASAPTALTPADVAHIWHIDYTFVQPPPQLSMLYAVAAPSQGSRNGFADMVAVYAALPQALKAQITHLHAVHYKHPNGVDVMPPGTEPHLPWAERQQGVAHPLVMQDANGLPFLCLPARRDSAIAGLDEAQSRALLDRLWTYVEPHGRPWEYEQASGELLIWDNRALLHKRSEWPLKKERLLWFLTTN